MIQGEIKGGAASDASGKGVIRAVQHRRKGLQKGEGGRSRYSVVS